MKKKTWWIVGIAALLVVILAVVLVIIAVGGKRVYSDSEKAEVVENLDDLFEFSKTVIPGEETPPVVSAIESLNGYELISMEDDGELTVATFRVYGPDIYSVAKELDSESETWSEADLSGRFLEKIAEAPIVETEVRLTVEIVGGEYKPLLTSEFLDAYYGGIYRLREEVLSNFGKEYK